MDSRRLLLAAGISLIFLVAYQSLMGRYLSTPNRPTPEEESMAGEDFSREVSETYTPPLVETSIQDEDPIFLNTDYLGLGFSETRGDIRTLVLSGYEDRLTGQQEILVNHQTESVGLFTLLFGKARTEWPGFAQDPDTSLANDGIQFVGTMDGIRMTKRYDTHPESRLLWATFEFENQKEEPVLLQYTTSISLTHPKSSGAETRFINAAWLSGEKVKSKGLGAFKKGHQTEVGDLAWTGFRTKYFCLLAKPLTPIKTQALEKSGEDEYLIFLTPEERPIYPGEKVVDKYLLYSGPQDETVLARVGHRFDKVIDYGFLGGISQLLMTVLRFFYRLVGNWGWAIVLLTVLVKVLLHPLTEKSLRSMKDLQSLQPKMNEIRKKHKESPQKVNEATIELYKTHKVNPLGGCLPILLQMPVFFALYSALMRAIELRGAHFALWIRDLSQPDRLLTLPWTLPFLGNGLNVLPIAMGVLTIWQQRLSAASSAQSDQQMAMAVVMPIMFIFLFYSLPSGLVLYWTTNTILTIAHQFAINRPKVKTA
jgi:YidC/Oxa1 family membrane protein insertase